MSDKIKKRKRESSSSDSNDKKKKKKNISSSSDEEEKDVVIKKKKGKKIKKKKEKVYIENNNTFIIKKKNVVEVEFKEETKSDQDIANDLHDKLVKGDITGKGLTSPHDQKFILLNSPKAREYILTTQRKKNSKRVGWCLKSTLTPSKEGGYVQPSYFDKKPFTLHKLAYYHETKILTNKSSHGSHRCIDEDSNLCFEVMHIVDEDPKSNNARKGCLVWVNCPHDGCKLLVILCKHVPICVKYYELAIDMDDLLKNHAHQKYELYKSQSQEEEKIKNLSSQ